MRVEPREGERGPDGGTHRHPQPTLGRLEGRGAQRAPGGLDRQDEQERGPAPAHDREQHGGVRDEDAQAGDARGDEHQVRQRAHQDHGQDVLAPQPLPQDERILRPDRDDQGQSGAEACEDEEPADAPEPGRQGQRFSTANVSAEP